MAFVVISISCGFAMIARINSTDLYRMIIILPFTFAFCSIFTPSIYRCLLRSPVTLLIVCGYFIRMVIAPTLFCIGNYTSFFPGIIIKENLSKAVVLLCLENLTVFLVSFFYSSKILSQEKSVDLEPEKYNSRVLAFIIVVVITFLSYAYITIPAISTIYYFLPTIKLNELASIKWDNEIIVPRGSITRYLYSLFIFLWPIVRVILPALCISQVYKKYRYRRIGLLLSLSCLFVPSILLGGDNVAPFFGAFLGILVIYRLYRERSKRAIFIIGVIFGLAFLVIISSKMLSFSAWKGATGIANVAQTINAYFPGFENMAVGFAIPSDEKLKTAFFDLYYAIPFRESLFGLQGKYLADLFAEVSSTGGQIVPWGFQIAYYFSIFMSPIITSFFIKVAYKAEIRSNKSNNFWKYYVNMYTSVFLAIAISVYSFSIFFREYVNIILPLMILSWVGNKRKNTINNKLVSTRAKENL